MNLLFLAKKLLGKYIKTRRKRLGISQVALAKGLGFSPQFLGNVEKGKVSIPKSKLKATVKELRLKKSTVRGILVEAAQQGIHRILEG